MNGRWDCTWKLEDNCFLLNCLKFGGHAYLKKEEERYAIKQERNNNEYVVVSSRVGTWR